MLQYDGKIILLRSTDPCITLMQPSGMPASCASFMINIVEPGFLSDGFKIMVLPHTSAIGNICNDIYRILLITDFLAEFAYSYLVVKKHLANRYYLILGWK